MNKIVVYRTHIKIFDYDLRDNTYIENMFSIYDMTYHKRFPKGMIYDSENRILMLPRGMDIGLLEKSFQCEAVVNADIDPCDELSPAMLKYKPRDEDQIQAIKFMLSMDKYKYNENHTMLSVNLNTGKGKTYCSIAVMCFLSMRSIIITDSIDLLKQWKSCILEYTSISEDEIYLISGSPSIGKLYNRDISKYRIFLCTHSTIQSIGNSQGWNKISELFKYCRIGLKFFDEAHMNFDNMFQIDCYTNTFLTYYLTATPGRSDQAENQIFKYYFKNVPSINLFHEDEDPHTKYAAIRFNSNPTPLDAKKCKNNYGLNRMAYVDYIVRNENFHKLLTILINMALKKPGKHLFYIGNNESIIYVRDWIYENFPELTGLVGIYTSLTPPDKKRSELDKKIILTTTKSAGQATDIKGLVEVVNLAEPFKSRVLAQQTLGRTRDANTIYKDVVDNGFYYTKKFYEFKKPTFNRYASECVEINLSKSELDSRYQAIIDARSRMIDPFVYDVRDICEDQ